MDWLNNLTSGENGSAISLVLITLAIAVLLIVVVWIFRKLTGSAARRAMRSRVPRLSITDSTTIDEKRYLVMVRRDNIEHLLLIGGANDLVVESNIVRVQASQKSNTVAAEAKEASIEATAHEEPSLAAPVAGAAAIGTAGLAAASSKLTETASSASENIQETTSGIIDTGMEVTADVSESVSDTVGDAFNDISETASVNVSESVEAITPEVIIEEALADAIPEVDLETAISAKLDDALSADALDLDTQFKTDEVSIEGKPKVTEPTVEITDAANTQSEGAKKRDNPDDEMQRLLDELTGDNKESA